LDDPYAANTDHTTRCLRSGCTNLS